jgi:hypothetical protein
MFRTSSLLAIGIGLATIGSATVPAAAFPKPSDVFGNAKHLTVNGGPISPTAPAATTGIKPSHVPITIPQGLPPTGAKAPVLGTALGPVKNPSPGSQPAPGPGTPAAPAPGSPVTNLPIDICPLTHKCPPRPIGHPGWPHGNGPIVILTPPVPVGVPVPVAVPGRVPTGTGMAVAAQPRPAIATPVQGCGTAATIPPLASGIDELLPNAHLAEADMTRVTSLRQTIQELSADGKESAARDAEEVAMNLLGYRKVWLSCGVGFDWVRQDASADAGQPK